jgi:hypothetical protein
MQASLAYLVNGTTAGSGTSRSLDQNPRGRAWATRTVGLYVSILPDSEMGAGSIGAEYRTLLANNYTFRKAELDAGGNLSVLGIPSLYQLGIWDTTGTAPMWMVDFWTATNGWLSELKPLTTMTDLIAVRDAMYKTVVGRLGFSGYWTDFDFTKGANYGLKISSTNNTADAYASWGRVFAENFGYANTERTNTLQGTSGSDPAAGTGYWAQLFVPLSYACDHGAPGAAEAYTRLVNTTNWSTLSAALIETPVNNIRPRLTVVPWTPSYSLPSSANTSTTVSTTNTWESVRASGHGTSEWNLSIFQSYCGMTFARKYSKGGAAVVAWTGGHTNLSTYDPTGLDFESLTFFRLPNANGITSSPSSVPQSQVSTDGYAEMLAASPGQMPCPRHQYGHCVYFDKLGPKGSFGMVGASGTTQDSNTNKAAHKVDLSTGLATRAATGFFSNSAGFVYGAAHDPTADNWYIYPFDLGNLSNNNLSYLRGSDMTWQTTANGPGYDSSSGSGYGTAAVYDKGRVLFYHRGTVLKGLDLTTPSNGFVNLTYTGTPPGSNGTAWVWHPRIKKFLLKAGLTGNVINTLTPPASGSAISGTWVFSSVTVGGAGIPDYVWTTGGDGNNHYAKFMYVPAVDRMAWVFDTAQVNFSEF